MKASGGAREVRPADRASLRVLTPPRLRGKNSATRPHEGGFVVRDGSGAGQRLTVCGLAGSYAPVFLRTARMSGQRPARQFAAPAKPPSSLTGCHYLVPTPMFTAFRSAVRPSAPARSRSIPSRTWRRRDRCSSVRSATSMPGIGLP